jgi:hypothetical protein
VQVYSRASVLGFSKEELDDILQAIQPEDLQVVSPPPPGFSCLASLASPSTALVASCLLPPLPSLQEANVMHGQGTPLTTVEGPGTAHNSPGINSSQQPS